MRLTSSLSLPVRKCIEAFGSRYPRLLDPARAASQCAIATHDLVALLAEYGETARIVWVRTPRVPFLRAHPRALAAREHALVELPDGCLIDFTRRQFDPDADVPTLYISEQSLADHWAEINDGERREEAWRTLRP